MNQNKTLEEEIAQVKEMKKMGLWNDFVKEARQKPYIGSSESFANEISIKDVDIGYAKDWVENK
jgi:hypothetical protein